MIGSSLSPEQHELRRGAISASEVGAIIGVDPWKRPIDVWMEKTGRRPSFKGNERTKWGVLLEPVIRSDYEERHGVRVEVHGTFVHPEHEWWTATPDGLRYSGSAAMPERGLEIKVHGADALRVLSYGAPGTDEVPAHELCQCMWGMGATGLQRWDLVAFLAGSPAEYSIERDDELLGQLAERAERFLVDHVRADKPPEPDGSDAYDGYLRSRFKHEGDELVPIDDATTIAAINDLRNVRMQANFLERKQGELEQLLKAIIGNKAGLTWSDPNAKGTSRITWKQNKPSLVTDYEGVAASLRAQAALVASAHAARARRVASRHIDDDEIALRTIIDTLEEIARGDIAVASNTTEVPGKRPFNVPRWWNKNKVDSASTEG